MKWLNLMALRRVSKFLKNNADTCKQRGYFTVGLRFSNCYYELCDIIRLIERSGIYRGKNIIT